MEKKVYHGSPCGNIVKLVPHKSTHQKEGIYGTEYKVVAMLYMAKWNDLDLRVSKVSGQLEVVERRKGILEKLYNKSGYLYELESSTFFHYDYLWSLEVISFANELIPLNKIYYPNILQAILEEEKNGNIVIYEYPNRPKNMPLDNSDLIDKFMGFEKRGLKGAVDDLLRVYPEFTSIVEKKMSK